MKTKVSGGIPETNNKISDAVLAENFEDATADEQDSNVS